MTGRGLNIDPRERLSTIPLASAVIDVCASRSYTALVRLAVITEIAGSTCPVEKRFPRRRAIAACSLVGHFSALLGAVETGFRALLTMVSLMLAALFAAALADLRAQLANLARERAVSRYEARSKTTDCRALHVKRDALRHGLYIRLL